MSSFDLVGTSAPKPFPKWLPPAGGLLAALLVAIFVNRLPFVHTLSPAEILGLDKAKARARATSLIGLVGLSGFEAH